MEIFILTVRYVWPSTTGDWHIEGVYSNEMEAKKAKKFLLNGEQSGVETYIRIEKWEVDKNYIIM